MRGVWVVGAHPHRVVAKVHEHPRAFDTVIPTGRDESGVPRVVDEPDGRAPDGQRARGIAARVQVDVHVAQREAGNRL